MARALSPDCHDCQVRWCTGVVAAASGAALLGSALGACSNPAEAKAEDKALEYVDSRLGVSGSALVSTRTGGECIVADVEAPDGERYRVILVAQLPNPEDPYDVFGMSQRFSLADFIGSSDVGCGIMKTDAYGQDENGKWVILG